MLTNKNGLVLLVRGLEKRIKCIGLFVEYGRCGCMKNVVLMKFIFQ